MKRKSALVVVMFSVTLVAASFSFWSGASATTTGTSSFLVPSASSAAATSNWNSYVSALSANGQYAIVGSGSSNSILGSSTHNSSFLLNINTDTATDFNVSTAGVEGSPTSGVLSAAVSETGRYVAFVSSATNLVAGVTLPDDQLYLHDTQAGTTMLLSQNASGVVANATIDAVDGVSSDGRFILFATAATNLGPATNGYENFYMLDRSTGTFTIVNLNTSGSEPTGQPVGSIGTGSAAMSCDGSLVVFSYIGDVDGGNYTHSNVYLLDRRAGNKITNITANISGWAPAGQATISCNGDYIGFVTDAQSVDPSQSNLSDYWHAYGYNRIDGSYHLLDQSTSGAAGNMDLASGHSSDCSDYSSGFSMTSPCVQVSDNGIAAFSTAAANLVSSAPSGAQAYVRNINTGETNLISQTADVSSNAYTPMGISADGKVVVYDSNADDLVSGGTDTNTHSDAFLYQTEF